MTLTGGACKLIRKNFKTCAPAAKCWKIPCQMTTRFETDCLVVIEIHEPKEFEK